MATFRLTVDPFVSVNWIGIKKLPGFAGVPENVSDVVLGLALNPVGRFAFTCQVPLKPAWPTNVEELIVPNPGTPTWNSRLGVTRNTGTSGFTVTFRVKVGDVKPGVPP